MRKLLLVLLICSGGLCQCQPRILFDASKAETAGNADWTIDADQHDLGFYNGPAVQGQGYESDPQRYPTPPQAGITAGTSETYWNGGISAWGVDLVKRGYQVETLPYNGAITYGAAGNDQDLSNYDVFVVCEPNIRFTAVERNSIIEFVQAGGGLFMISDHDQSDRNGDGWDSPSIWNDLMSNNTVQVEPFGITFDLQQFNQTSSNIANLPGDTLLHGPMGEVTQVKWSAGTSMTLHPEDAPSVTGVIYRTSANNAGTTQVLCARVHFGQGRVVAIGDSSPCDDGTGDPNDFLYNGYYQDANGNHRRLLLNATIWLVGGSADVAITEQAASLASLIFPDPVTDAIGFLSTGRGACEADLLDASGRTVRSWHIQLAERNTLSVAGCAPGIYLLSLRQGDSRQLLHLAIQ